MTALIPIAAIIPLWLFALYLSVSKYRMRIKHIEEMHALRRSCALAIWAKSRDEWLKRG